MRPHEQTRQAAAAGRQDAKKTNGNDPPKILAHMIDFHNETVASWSNGGALPAFPTKYLAPRRVTRDDVVKSDGYLPRAADCQIGAPTRAQRGHNS